jgi:hypothetical protein
VEMGLKAAEARDAQRRAFQKGASRSPDRVSEMVRKVDRYSCEFVPFDPLMGCKIQRRVQPSIFTNEV